MILADLPYGTTAFQWDSKISLKQLWKQYSRVQKETSTCVLTASQPFTTDLINSNRGCFKYEWIWHKMVGSNFQLANIMPLKTHENILVFGRHIKYNPQKKKREKVKDYSRCNYSVLSEKSVHFNSKNADVCRIIRTEKYPESVISISSQRRECNNINRIHGTQKPVELFQYLILTYTNKGDIVLDNVIGSGTTAIAAYNTGRRWIGIEKDPDIFDMACERIEKETRQQNLFN